ncbi:MAG: hypothetical protein HQL29_03840 [Candidatus Omnitrophica bacterium]|nr:hypothetical protein [Candidatus Omnitrophota bacterium]
MLLKKKHFSFIFFSASVIISVMILTVLGLQIYTGWEDATSLVKYNKKISALTAGLFAENINIHNLSFEVADETSRDILVSGKIQNNTNKTLLTMEIGLSFVRKDGFVVAKYPINPLSIDTPFDSPFFSTQNKTLSIIGPAEIFVFKSRINNILMLILDQVKKKKNFAKNSQEDDMSVQSEISSLGLE